MAVEIDTPTHTSPAPATTVVDEQLYCALTGKPISHHEAYWAPPLVTARDLVAAIGTAIFRAPDTLGHVLLGEQPNVPYASDARDLLAKRRSQEQLKLLVGMLVLAALIAAPILYIAFS
jgi:hypothetical protein